MSAFGGNRHHLDVAACAPKRTSEPPSFSARLQGLPAVATTIGCHCLCGQRRRSRGAGVVRLGLVACLNRPGGNATGVTILAVAVAPMEISSRLEGCYLFSVCVLGASALAHKIPVMVHIAEEVPPDLLL